MDDELRPAGESLVSAAEIARLAGVTRAAVSNWRKRYDDFPGPAGGGYAMPCSPCRGARLAGQQRKGNDVSGEVLLWQALRSTYGDDMTRGLADVCELFSTGAPAALDTGIEPLGDGPGRSELPRRGGRGPHRAALSTRRAGRIRSRCRPLA